MSTTNQHPPELISKIEKLLNLAARGGTEAEATAAFEAASRLMTKHGIAQHQINGKKEQAPQFARVDLNVPTYASERPYHLYIRQLIRTCFNVSIIAVRYRGAKCPNYYMVGTPEDCAFATYAFEVLCKTFLRLVNQYLKEQNLPRTPRYFNGYWDGLRIGFCDAWQKAQRSEIKQAGAESYALVLVDKDKALTAFIAQDKDIKMKSTQRNTDHGAVAAGIRDGAKISIHRALGGASDNKVQLS